MQYALDQYSQADEQRQDMKAEGTYAKDTATAQKTQAQIPDEQMQPAMTEAEITYKEALVIDILRPDNAGTP